MSISKTYDTRRKRKSTESVPKSRVDWKRTKIDNISSIIDTDESDSSEEELEEPEEDDGDSSSTGESEDFQQNCSTLPADDGEEECVKKPRHISRSGMITSSDSSSDSDGPGRKINIKRRFNIEDDDENGLLTKDLKESRETSEDEENKAYVKRQKRLENLKQLAEQRRSRGRKTSHKSFEESPSDTFDPLTPGTSSDNEESGDMSDFIVNDDEVEDVGDHMPTCQELFMKHNISQFACSDLYSHLQKVIKAYLINIADNNFLKTLYEGERKKKYAKEMLKSLNHLEQRIIMPRLEKLTTSCRWSKRYKERVSSYPRLFMKEIGAEQQPCDACELNRHCKFLITLSGQAYDNNTLQNDDFLSNDKQILLIGTTCAGRTKVYHKLKHYKYHLYQRCVEFLPDTENGSVKEMVEIALTEMEGKEFIKEELDLLERHLNEAEFFQDEVAESLFS